MKDIAYIIIIIVIVFVILISYIIKYNNISTSGKSLSTAIEPTQNDYYPVFSKSTNSVQSLNTDNNFFYNPNTNTLSTYNIKTNKILDTDGNFGNLNDILTIDSNNNISWKKLDAQTMLNSCDFSNYKFDLDFNVIIEPTSNIEYLLSPTNETLVSSNSQDFIRQFNKNTMLSNIYTDNIWKFLTVAPFSSTNQQYSGFYKITTTKSISYIRLKIYKIDRSSLEFGYPINLTQVLNVDLYTNKNSEVKSCPINECINTFTSYNSSEISKGDLLFTTITPVFSTIDTTNSPTYLLLKISKLFQ